MKSFWKILPIIGKILKSKVIFWCLSLFLRASFYIQFLRISSKHARNKRENYRKKRGKKIKRYKCCNTTFLISLFQFLNHSTIFSMFTNFKRHIFLTENLDVFWFLKSFWFLKTFLEFSPLLWHYASHYRFEKKQIKLFLIINGSAVNTKKINPEHFFLFAFSFTDTDDK